MNGWRSVGKAAVLVSRTTMTVSSAPEMSYRKSVTAIALSVFINMFSSLIGYI